MVFPYVHIILGIDWEHVFDALAISPAVTGTWDIIIPQRSQKSKEVAANCHVNRVIED